MSRMIPWCERELDRFRGEIDRMFKEFSTRSPLGPLVKGRDWLPPVDVSEDPDEIVIQMDIPGIAAEEVDIFLAGRMLTVKGERQLGRDKKSYHRSERWQGSFSDFSRRATRSLSRDGRSARLGGRATTLPPALSSIAAPPS